MMKTSIKEEARKLVVQNSPFPNHWYVHFSILAADIQMHVYLHIYTYIQSKSLSRGKSSGAGGKSYLKIGAKGEKEKGGEAAATTTAAEEASSSSAPPPPPQVADEVSSLSLPFPSSIYPTYIWIDAKRLTSLVCMSHSYNQTIKSMFKQPLASSNNRRLSNSSHSLIKRLSSELGSVDDEAQSYLEREREELQLTRVCLYVCMYVYVPS